MTSVRILCCAAAVSGFIGSSPGPISTTRFQFDASGRVVLPVAVDGTLHSFVMDTATPSSAISAPIATTLHRSMREERSGVRLLDDLTLELLGVVLPHQVLRVSDEQALDDGVIGAELCQRFVVKVDFRSRRITLWERSAVIDTRHAVIVPADFANAVPVINARIGAAGVRPSAATLVVGLGVPPGGVSFSYRYAAESGLLDAARAGALPIELRGIAKAPLSAVAQVPREPEREALLFADGIASARALSRSWIVFDAARNRIVLGR